VTAVCFILLSSPLHLFSFLRSCLDGQGAKREITRHHLCENVQVLLSVLQEEFASRLVGFCCVCCLLAPNMLFLVTCFVSVVVAVDVLALRFVSFALVARFPFVSAFCVPSVGPFLQNVRSL